MIKNKLFTIITIASLCAFACYGMDIEDNYGMTYNTSDGWLINYDKATKITTYYDRNTGKETILPPINIQKETELLHTDKQQTTTDHEKLPIVKFSQPASMNIINSTSNRLGNLQRELDLLASPRRHHDLFNTLKRKIIQTNYNTISLCFNSAKQTTTQNGKI